MVNDKHPIVRCPSCGKPMRLASIIPGIGALPELRTFECRDCVEAVTEAQDALLSEVEEKSLEAAV